MRACQNCNRPLNGGRADRRFCRASRCRVAAYRARRTPIDEARRTLAAYTGDDFWEQVRQLAYDIYGESQDEPGISDGEMLDRVEDTGHRMVITTRPQLVSTADIDCAEATGDWTPMVQAAADSMRQSFPDYQPDLSEWPDVERWFYGD